MKKFLIVSEQQRSGKTVISSYIAALLDHNDIDVQFLKLNQALSTRLGLLSPLAVGEAFITNDGAQVDKDVGIIERSIKTVLSSKSCLTLGQAIYSTNATELNSKDCAYDFLSVDEHLIQYIVDYINSFDDTKILVIELGGSILDLGAQPFIQAIIKLQQRSDIELLYIGDNYEIPQRLFKSQPQVFINFMENKDILLKKMINDNIQLQLDSLMQSYLAIKLQPFNLEETYLHIPYEKFEQSINIALVCRFASKLSAYLSLVDNIKSSCFYQQLSPKIKTIQSKLLNDANVEYNLRDADCIVIPGGFGDAGQDGLLAAIKYGRTKLIPTIGVGLGFQMFAIEFARNICKLQDANSYEMDSLTPCPIIHSLEYLAKKKAVNPSNLEENKTKYHIMHVGDAKLTIEQSFDNYAKSCFHEHESERTWHSYTINPEYWQILQENGLVPVMWDVLKQEIFAYQLMDHPFFFSTQIHPEFKSTYIHPHPIFIEFVKKASKYRQDKPGGLSNQSFATFNSPITSNIKQ